MTTQHNMPKPILDAFDNYCSAQQRYVELKRRYVIKQQRLTTPREDDDVALAEKDRDQARKKFDELLDEFEAKE